jgi:hypothetical protein
LIGLRARAAWSRDAREATSRTPFTSWYSGRFEKRETSAFFVSFYTSPFSSLQVGFH